MSNSVGPTPGFHIDPFMTAMGYTVVAVLFIVFLPLLPLIAVIWLLSGSRTSSDAEAA